MEANADNNADNADKSGRSSRHPLRLAADVVVFLVTALAIVVRALVRSFLPKKQKSLAGEVVLVTGGSGGLGRLLALRLARLKAVVVLWDINAQGLEETVKLVEGIGGTVHGYVCDISKRENVYKAAAQTQTEVGQVTILINNAGVANGCYFLDTPDHLIQKTFDINVLAHYWTVKAFLPGMIKKNHGHIVTIASMAGLMGVHKLVDYCGSKFAAVGFDEALRLELQMLNIRGIQTTVVCPYFLKATGMFDEAKLQFVPVLSTNYVADRIVNSIRANDLYVMIPGFFRIMLLFKWAVPWAVISRFMSSIVPEPNPKNATFMPVNLQESKMTTIQEKNTSSADVTLHHRVAVSERKP